MGSGTDRRTRLRSRQLQALWDDGDDEGLDAACAHSGCSACRADRDDGDAGRADPIHRRRRRATALQPRSGQPAE